MKLILKNRFTPIKTKYFWIYDFYIVSNYELGFVVLQLSFLKGFWQISRRHVQEHENIYIIPNFHENRLIFSWCFRAKKKINKLFLIR